MFWNSRACFGLRAAHKCQHGHGEGGLQGRAGAAPTQLLALLRRSHWGCGPPVGFEPTLPRRGAPTGPWVENAKGGKGGGDARARVCRCISLIGGGVVEGGGSGSQGALSHAHQCLATVSTSTALGSGLRGFSSFRSRFWILGPVEQAVQLAFDSGQGRSGGSQPCSFVIH